ncbi:pyridoxal phosphate-dependent aminotransferase [Candidatus Roizmanbacteria bacterium]|nr:MAG: pyridoxal phosphate-dependent aminotransferase [Candidatus Roizmanbacteria bacterium]
MKSLSKRINNLPVSSIRKLIPLADRAKKEGVSIYHLNMGQPDVKSPDVMISALQNWNQNPIAYAPSGGTPEYLQALVHYYYQLGFSFIKSEHIIGTIAGSEAINMAMFAVCDPGDEILIFEPYYSSYQTSAQLWGITLVPIPTKIEAGFHLPDTEEIESRITEKTKAILYSSPSNPTGTVYQKEEIKLLIDLIKKHNLFLIADEVYREYIFIDRPHVSILDYIQDIPDQGILIDSLSKRYNLCGARLGSLITLNEGILKGALKFAMSRLSGGLIDQYVGSQLTRVPDGYIKEIQTEYRKRRDTMYAGLSAIPDVKVTLPEGAFYIMAELPVDNAEAFCIWLLEEFRDNNETVMMAPGYGFYKNPEDGKKMVRIAYVLEIPSLERSIELLKKALREYNRQ